ncbi:MAG: metallophosphoesterase [Candidatus Hadarchaeum sp.]|uniref:metallophosphoesterase n=1 Tax=Candidatus Hadarchaeum sp. TaxID=2883567 RepID=UPI003D0DBBCA
MKLLAAADFHGNSGAENNLSKLLRGGHDCLVLIGDLTNFGPPEVAESLLDLVKAHGITCFCVPGNCDPKSILQVLDRRGVNLHGRCSRLGEFNFLGLGGSNLTPFNTPFELTEAEIQEELATASCDTVGELILVTHAPPHGTEVDRIREGTHVGSKSIRQFIEKRQPLLSLCAHVHEGRGVDQLGRTLVINPGPMTKGFAAEIEIGENNQVNFRLLEI